MIDEKYPSERFEKVLKRYLGDKTKLSQAITDVLITSYEIETCRPFIFTRRKARAKQSGRFNPAHVGGRPLHRGGPDLFRPVPDQSTTRLASATAHVHRRRRVREQPDPLAYAEAVNINTPAPA